MWRILEHPGVPLRSEGPAGPADPVVLAEPSYGGFLRQGNTTFLIGLEDHETDRAIDIVQEGAPPFSGARILGRPERSAAFR